MENKNKNKEKKKDNVITIRTKFNANDAALIMDISRQYVDLYKMVKKICPKDMPQDIITYIYAKTDAMFNQIKARQNMRIKEKVVDEMIAQKEAERNVDDAYG